MALDSGFVAGLERNLRVGLKLRDPDAMRCVQSDASTIWVGVPVDSIGISEAGYRQIVDSDALAAKVRRIVADAYPVQRPQVTGVPGDNLFVAVIRLRHRW